MGEGVCETFRKELSWGINFNNQSSELHQGYMFRGKVACTCLSVSPREFKEARLFPATIVVFVLHIKDVRSQDQGNYCRLG